MKLLCRLLILVFIALKAQYSVAAQKQITVIYDKHNKTVKQFFDVFSQKISAKLCQIESCKLTETDIVITLGSKALESQINVAKSRVIAIYITQEKYQSIIDANPNAPPSTAIFSDPNLISQLNLARAIHQKPVLDVGVLLSKETEFLEDIIRASTPNVKIQYVDGNINKALNKLKSCDSILAIPDKNIYSNKTIKNIILTTYRRNQSIIGYSKGLVKAGASATIYYDSEIISNEVVTLFSKIKGGVMPPAKHPTNFKISTNKQVIKSLDLHELSQSDISNLIGESGAK